MWGTLRLQVRDTEIAAATFRELQEALADAEVQLQDSHNDRSMAVALEEQLQDVRAQLEDAVPPPPTPPSRNSGTPPSLNAPVPRGAGCDGTCLPLSFKSWLCAT